VGENPGQRAANVYSVDGTRYSTAKYSARRCSKAEFVGIIVNVCCVFANIGVEFTPCLNQEVSLSNRHTTSQASMRCRQNQMLFGRMSHEHGSPVRFRSCFGCRRMSKIQKNRTSTTCSLEKFNAVSTCCKDRCPLVEW
jgi:hypothetical protein